MNRIACIVFALLGLAAGCSAEQAAEARAVEAEIAFIASTALGALPAGTYSAEVNGGKISWTKPATGEKGK